MYVLKATPILEIFILLIFVASCCDAWGWGRRSSSGSSSSSSSSSSESKTKESGAKAKEIVAKAYAKAKESAKNVVKFPVDAVKGANSMADAYKDMLKVNSNPDFANVDKTGVDKYFHALANYEAAKHGQGGEFAAKVISDAREFVNQAKALFSKEAKKDSAEDQKANEYGRNGGDPNAYRPEWLPSE